MAYNSIDQKGKLSNLLPKNGIQLIQKYVWYAQEVRRYSVHRETILFLLFVDTKIYYCVKRGTWNYGLGYKFNDRRNATLRKRTTEENGIIIYLRMLFHRTHRTEYMKRTSVRRFDGIRLLCVRFMEIFHILIEPSSRNSHEIRINSASSLLE